VTTTEEFDACEIRIAQLGNALHNERKKLQEIYLRKVFEKHGVKQGSIVICSFGFGRGKEECIIDSVYTKSMWHGKPWVLVRTKNKNGEWSSLVRNAYGEWTLKE